MFSGLVYAVGPGDEIMYMPMDGDPNDIVGLSPYLLEGTGIFYEDGVFDQQIFFLNAADQATYTKDFSGIGTGGIAISFWYSRHSSNNWQMIAEIPGVFRIYTGADGASKIGFTLEIGGVDYTVPGDTTSFSTGHVLCTYDGFDMKVYSNGALVGENNGINLPVSTTGTNLILSGSDQRFRMDDVRVYGDGLSPADAAALYAYSPHPKITSQPAAVELSALGTNESFTVVAVSPGGGTADLTYAWYKDDVLLEDGGDISGATTATLAINTIEAADLGLYTCFLTYTPTGTTATSGLAPLTIYVPPSLIMHMPMEGDPNDIVGNNDVIATGVVFEDGRVGQCMLINDNSDNLIFPDVAFTSGEITLAFWVKEYGTQKWATVFSIPGSFEIFSMDPYTDAGFNLFWSDNRPYDTLRPTNDCFGGDWDHVAFTYDKVSMKTWLNGVEIGASSPINKPMTTGTGLVIANAANAWRGFLDEVKIYNYGMDSAEMFALYASYLEPGLPHTITDQPDSTPIKEGQDVTLTVVARNPYTNDSTDLLYQWYKDDVLMTGEESADLTITGATIGDAGVYYCTVTFGDETLVSADAVLSAIVIAYDPVPDSPTSDTPGAFTELSWTLPMALCGEDLTVDVWFGTDSFMETATNIDSGTNITSTTNFTVVEDQAYYWRVDVTDPDTCGGGAITSKGDIWSLTVTPCDPALEADLTGDCIVNLDDFAVLAGEWLSNSN